MGNKLNIVIYVIRSLNFYTWKSWQSFRGIRKRTVRIVYNVLSYETRSREIFGENKLLPAGKSRDHLFKTVFCLLSNLEVVLKVIRLYVGKLQRERKEKKIIVRCQEFFAFTRVFVNGYAF